MSHTDREAHNAYQREYRKRNLEKLRKYNRNWMKKYRRSKRRAGAK